MNEPGIRATQVADLIRDIVAPQIQRDHAGFFVSVNQVTLTPDMSRANVWISVYPKESAEKVLTLVRRKTPKYNSVLRRQMQKFLVPTLSFKLDRIEEDAARIDDLLS